MEEEKIVYPKNFEDQFKMLAIIGLEISKIFGNEVAITFHLTIREHPEVIEQQKNVILISLPDELDKVVKKENINNSGTDNIDIKKTFN